MVGWYDCASLFYLKTVFLVCKAMFLFTHSTFSCSSVSKGSACNAGDPGSLPGSGRYPGEGNGNPLQYSCLENSMDRGGVRATVHEVARVGHNLVTKAITCT